ncbi:MAG: 1-acyl-sn-glycerol-3-phosphate acyltransferase [Thermodesulfobacteriota bacterium]
MTLPSRDGRARTFDPDSLSNRNPYLIDWLIPPIGWALTKYFRAEVRGVERIPKGAALYVGNHNMITYTLDTGIFLAEAYKVHGMDAMPYALQHDLGVVAPVLRRLAAFAGGMRASKENARRVFAAGKKVLTYPGGDLDACRPFRDRDKIVFGGRTGYIKLALRENVPVVPVVAAGAQAVFYILSDMRSLAKMLKLPERFRISAWPLTLSMPLGITLGPPPLLIPYPSRILMEVMEPVRFDRSGPEAAADPAYVRECADRVESAMQQTLTLLALERRQRSRRAAVKAS